MHPPRISIVTPSYNQGRFLEETICSVLDQKYPNLEYIIVDGGSTDNSVEIIRRYEKHLAWWVSEKDRGQSHAINKGLSRATGDVLCWLNSDDYYVPEALWTVSRVFASRPDVFAVAGHVRVVNENGGQGCVARGRYESRLRLLQYWKGYQMHQPSIFWRREVTEQVGFLDEDLYYTMDFDYWSRIAERFDFVNIDAVLSCARSHHGAKTGDGFVRYYEELRQRIGLYAKNLPAVEYWHFWGSLWWGLYCTRAPGIRTISRLGRKFRRRHFASA